MTPSSDEGADRLDLVFLLLLGIGELQVDAALLGLLLGDGAFQRRASRIRSRSARSRQQSSAADAEPNMQAAKIVALESAVFNFMISSQSRLLSGTASEKII